MEPEPKMSTNSSTLIDISGKLYSRPGFMPLLLFKCFSSGSCCFSHPSHHSFCSSHSAYSQSSHLTSQKWTSCSCPSPSDCRSQSSHLTNQKWTSCSCPSPSECEGRCGHWEGPCRGPTLGWDLTWSALSSSVQVRQEITSTLPVFVKRLFNSNN